MKTKRIYLGLLLLSAVVFIGCSEESVGPGPEPSPGEEQEVRLQISTYEEGILSRADEEKGLQDEEGTINNNKVMIFVYDDKGNLEYENTDVTLENEKSESFKLKTGTKYFYVFANPLSTSPIVSKPKRADFEKQIMGITFPDPDKEEIPNITDPYFLMGTLWPVAQTIEKKSKGEITEVSVDIGRLAAKVKLWRVNGENYEYSNLKGRFTNPRYSIGSVPVETFLVGQLLTPNGQSPKLPPDPNHDVVESAVHNEPGVQSDGINQNPKFYNYFTDSLKFYTVDGNINTNELKNFFYVIENTTALDNNDYQYYGNTTHIRLETVYVPDQKEIFSDDLSQSGNETLDQGTFWTCMYQGKKYITNKQPLEKTGLTDVMKYQNGKNYHFFPIMDERNTTNPDELIVYSVLRNHYYEIEVTGIRDLGVGDRDKENPWVPIPKSVDVQVKVNVVDWSKITQKTEI